MRFRVSQTMMARRQPSTGGTSRGITSSVSRTDLRMSSEMSTMCTSMENGEVPFLAKMTPRLSAGFQSRLAVGDLNLDAGVVLHLRKGYPSMAYQRSRRSLRESCGVTADPSRAGDRTLSPAGSRMPVKTPNQRDQAAAHGGTWGWPYKGSSLLLHSLIKCLYLRH